jgi:hypothetical protein
VAIIYTGSKDKTCPWVTDVVCIICIDHGLDVGVVLVVYVWDGVRGGGGWGCAG